MIDGNLECADGVSPNALVRSPGQVDAAPCGSGTCARMALSHHRGFETLLLLMAAISALTALFVGFLPGQVRAAVREPEGAAGAVLSGG